MLKQFTSGMAVCHPMLGTIANPPKALYQECKRRKIPLAWWRIWYKSIRTGQSFCALCADELYEMKRLDSMIGQLLREGNYTVVKI